MSAKRTERTTDCNKADARSRMIDARAFLDVADVADNDDVIATNAIHAAIAAADVLCCLALATRSTTLSHADAVDLLRRVDTSRANSLRRCLELKNRAAYETRDLSPKDSTTTVRHAKSLVEAAEKALLAAP